MNLKQRRREAAHRAVKLAGGRVAVAKRGKINWQTVDDWLTRGLIPTERVRLLCRMTKLEAWQVDPAIPRPSKRYQAGCAARLINSTRTHGAIL